MLGRRLFLLLALVCCAGLGDAGAQPAAPDQARSGAPAPRRIASFNLCADQLVLALAEPAHIAGLSPFAGDPEISVAAAQAGSFRMLPQRSEAAIALKPDLVLVGPSDRAGMRAVLERSGLRVAEVPLVADLAQARAQILAVAALLGEPQRGEALAAALDAAAARLAEAARGRHETALLVERSGYVTGPESLAAALLRLAGFVPPVGAPAGLGGFLPLERLLMLHPDRLAFYDAVQAPSDQGALYLAHPALQALYPPEKRLVLPRKYALCGGPALVAALDYLRELVSTLR